MAAPDITVRVTGLREMEQALRDLGEEYSPRGARRALNIPMRNAMRIVSEEIMARTPIDTGRLAETTAVMSTPPTREWLRSNPDSVWTARAGWFWTSPARYWFQALAVEYGTSRQTGNSVLRTALQSNIDNVIRTFSSELGPQIERRAEQLARNRLRRSRRGR